MRRTSPGFTLVEIMIVVAIIGMIIAIAVPTWVRAREISRATGCQENLVKIEGAVESYAMDHSLVNGAAIPGGWNDLVGTTLYLKKTPKCRGGGLYTNTFTVGLEPVCSYSLPAWLQRDIYLHAVPPK